MKKLILLFIVIGITYQIAQSQTYYPFPTDSAKWNSLFWHQWSEFDINVINSQYFLQGDTILKDHSYNKVYFMETNDSSSFQYIGGLREDSDKNIFFFPYQEILPGWGQAVFPNDTTESLLYTFKDLEIGMILPINTGNTQITVVGVDSILLGENYRKRYEVHNEWMFPPEYWIEGIGSTKDLFAPFKIEFEWLLYTLCYEDTISYYINAPFGEDSCHYTLVTGIAENTIDVFKIFPNPAHNEIIIEGLLTKKSNLITIYNSYGQLIMRIDIEDNKTKVDISGFEPGIYLLELETTDGFREVKRFIVE